MSLVASHQKLGRFSSNEQKNYATAVSTCRLGRTSHRDEISCPTYRPIFPQLGSFTWQHKVDKLVLVRPKPPSTDSTIILESMKLSPICSMYGIYANIGGILMVNVTIYSSTMDPSWVRTPTAGPPNMASPTVPGVPRSARQPHSLCI